MKQILGYILRANTSTAVSGCRLSDQELPQLGGLVKIPQNDGHIVFGIITDQRIEDDGLVRQLVTAADIREDVIADNRHNRTIPIEINILFCGFAEEKTIFHLLPPRPPLTLEEVLPCSAEEMCRFTNSGRFGYFRHILRGKDFSVGELLALHLKQVHQAQSSSGYPGWINLAMQELITLLRDDYPTLMDVLGALADTGISQLEG